MSIRSMIGDRVTSTAGVGHLTIHVALVLCQLWNVTSDALLASGL